MTTIATIIKTKPLRDSTTPRLDLELLLEKVLEKPRGFLYTHPAYELSLQQEEIFESLYQRRCQGEPLAYILGKKEFWSLELMVNEKVLVPRPETELLVEIILAKVKHKTATIADLGTGSGAIALALASERPHWQIIATDISEEALQVARHNATHLQIKNIEFYCGSWCAALPKQLYNVIVSNPPYGTICDPILEQKVLKFEPKIAVAIGNDGLDALREIIIQAKNNLTPAGLLVLEHGYNQSEAVQQLLQKNNYHQITAHQDLAGIKRAVVGQTS